MQGRYRKIKRQLHGTPGHANTFEAGSMAAFAYPALFFMGQSLEDHAVS